MTLTIFKKGISKFFSKPFLCAPLPAGIKIILWYMAILAVFQFLIGILIPIIYPQMLSFNPMIVLFNFIFLMVCAVIIFGILKRKYWAHKLTIIWYFATIVYNFLYFFYTFDIFDAMSEILLIGLIFSFVVNCVVIWYLFSQEDYFKHKGVFLLHRRIRLKMIEAHDHIFMVVFFSFWFVTVLVLMFAGAELMSQTFSISKQVISDVQKAGFYDVSLCSENTGMYSDVCFMTFGITNKDASFCELISSPFYKFTCYMGV